MRVLRFALLFAASVAFSAHSQETSSTGAPIDEPTGTSSASSDTPAESGSPDSDDSSTGATADSATAPTEEDLVMATIALDIATSSYYQLVEWCRELGLNEGGDQAALRNRLYEHYGVNAPEGTEASGYVVTIVSARRTEYYTVEKADDSVVRLSGGVSVIVVEIGKTDEHSIVADEIIFNRTQNTLTARGNVRYEKKGGSTSEVFFGDSLTIDLDTWQGTFYEGVTSIEGGEDGAGLSLSADEITRSGDGVLVLEDAIITSCADRHPHYSIRAGKMWLLGANEWAIFDATLRIGEIPYMWLPFFYYPGEEIVFHPVLGTKDRVGAFVQTTTYLLGEKPATEESISFFKMTTGTQGMKREVKGVFLRTTSEKAADAGDDSLKVMVDLYTNLGAFIGVDGIFTLSEGFLTNAKFSAGLGLSRSVFAIGDGAYSPYSEASNFESVWNFMPFLGITLPFRIGVESSFTAKAGPWSATLLLTLFSDPFFKIDFMQRSEDMRWLKFLEQETEEQLPSEVASLSQTLTQNLTLDVGFLSPWVQSITIDKIVTSLIWKSKSDTSGSMDPELLAVDPFRKFFYLDTATLFFGGFTATGTLFSFELGSDPQASSAAPAQTASPAASVDGFEPMPPWEEPEPSGEASADAGDGGANAGQESAAPATVEGGGMVPDPRAKDIDPAESRKPLSVKLTYSLTPSAKYEIIVASKLFKSVNDVNFDPLCTLLKTSLSGSLSVEADAWEKLLYAKLTLTGVTKDQTRPYVLDDPNYVADVLSFATVDAPETADSIGFEFTFSSKPFQDIYFLSLFSFLYKLDGYVYQVKYSAVAGSVVPTEAWLFSPAESGALVNDSLIKAHSATFTIGILPFEAAQTISVSASLPPLPESYAYTLGLTIGPFTLSANTAYFYDATGDKFSWKDLPLVATFNFGDWGKLTNSATYSIEDGHFLSDSLSYTLGTFSLSLDAKWSREWTPGLAGWEQTGDEAFRFSTVKMGYKLIFKPEPFWMNRISTDLSFGINYSQDFLKFTESSISVDFKWVFKVHEFLDITFSAYSSNKRPYLYYPWLFGLDGSYWVNPIEDIANAFNFFDGSGAARRSALFKVSSLNFSLTHYMHDWKLTFTATVVPVKNEDTRVYDLVTTFTVLVAWIPIPEFETTLTQASDGTISIR